MSITKQMAATPLVWMPDVEGNDGTAMGGYPARKVFGGAELSHAKLSSGSGAAVISLHDCKDAVLASQQNIKMVLDSSNTGNDNMALSNPIVFRAGIVAVMQQGAGTNPALSIGILK